LKSAIEDGGPVLISGLAGGLKSATGLLTKIKGGQAGAKAVQALAKLSNDAQEAIRALKLNEPEIARIAELVQKSPQVADDLLRQYLYKMRKAERKSLPFSRPADIGKDIEQSIENYNLVKGRGYPFGFQNVQQYQKFGENLTSALKKYNIPIGNIKVHGSAVHKTKPGDLDIAVLVSEQEFKNLGQRFYENARTSKRKKEIMQAISKGKIPSYYFGPGKGESVGTSIYGKSGDLSAQISLIVEKTEFDIGPYFNVSP
jgi:soluble lytic murein transglycosylase-like protein